MPTQLVIEQQVRLPAAQALSGQASVRRNADYAEIRPVPAERYMGRAFQQQLVVDDAQLAGQIERDLSPVRHRTKPSTSDTYDDLA